MSSPLAFTGSKRAARRLAADAREVARVKRDLAEIATFVPFIRDEAHLQQILATAPNLATRDAIETLIRKFQAPEPPC